MKNIKVLLIDDTIIRWTKDVFESIGYSVDILKLTSSVADENFSETDLIIIDPVLGEKGEAGTLIDTLKSRVSTSRIPILLCSHEDNDRAIVNGLNAGANDFILLPTTPQFYTDRIKHLISH